jgi:TctA family transporter
MAEEHFRRALLLSRGDAMVFLTEPISAGLLATAAIIVASTIWSSLRRRKRALADTAA